MSKDSDKEFDELRRRYFEILRPLFYPKPEQYDVLDFLCSILRVVGMEDGGWDPYLESRKTLEDFNSLFKIRFPKKRFPDANASTWRFGLLFYAHMVEMDAVYEVITNLLRYHLGEGYSPNPFFKYLSPDRQKSYARRSLSPTEKIEIIKSLSKKLNCPVGDAFDEFYSRKLRNPVAHSDYILTDTEFRCRNGTGAVGAYSIPLEEVNRLIFNAKAFYSAFFGVDHAARTFLAQQYSKKAFPYDPHYKGLMELLRNKKKLLSGFKVHWPNGSESVYERNEDGITMTNMSLGKDLKVELFVDRYARNKGSFSPLVERGEKPLYTPLANGSAPHWPKDT